MNKVKTILVDFVKADFKGTYYGFNLFYLLACLYLNYVCSFEDTYIDVYKRQWFSYVVNYLYYFIPFAVSIGSYMLTHPRHAWPFKKGAFLHVILLFAMLSIYVTFYHHKILIEQYMEPQVQYYVKLVSNNFVSALLMFVMAFLYWRYLDGEAKNCFYGFTNHGVSLKPYFTMILIMLPLVSYASWQPAFLKSYPIYYPQQALAYWRCPEWLLIAFFELNYGFDFVATELFFRGLLVIGLAKYLGKACIVPMVVCYCIFHFGKPFAEALSSIFGGYILGVLAYKTKSIYGGIIIHLAVAYMMEIGGALGQHYLTSP